MCVCEKSRPCAGFFRWALEAATKKDGVQSMIATPLKPHHIRHVRGR
jgi:hypothetical protein